MLILPICFNFQLCSGVDENAVGTCAELIFAPIDASFSDDAPLLPSGFRIIPLESGHVSLHVSNIIKKPLLFYSIDPVALSLHSH